MMDSSENLTFLERLKVAVPFLSGNSKYQPLAQQEEGRVALGPDSPVVPESDDREANQDDGEEAISLLANDSRRKPKRKSGSCCMCCGLNCSLFWKIIGVLFALSVLFYGTKFVLWLIKPTPTGLENMPAYSTSLGCSDAPFLYNSSAISLSSPVGSLNQNHFVDVRGIGVGTISIATGDEDATEVHYEMTIRSNYDDQLEFVKITERPVLDDQDGSVVESRLAITTPLKKIHEDACVRYDIILYVPPNLKKLHVASHAERTHVRFDPDARLDLDSSLFVTVYGTSSQNLILPHENIRAGKLNLEVFNGWIVGDVALLDETKIKTQRGRGVANVKVHPSGSPSEDPSQFFSVTGGGRTDIAYLGGAERRPIRSSHISTDPNSEMYLTYGAAGFNGRIELDAKSYSLKNTASLGSSDPVPGKTKDSVKEKQWTHYVGSTDGPDEIRADTRGWVGMYF